PHHPPPSSPPRRSSDLSASCARKYPVKSVWENSPNLASVFSVAQVELGSGVNGLTISGRPVSGSCSTRPSASRCFSNLCPDTYRSEEHTSELQSRENLV